MEATRIKRLGKQHPLILVPAVEDFLMPTKGWQPQFTKYSTGYSLLEELKVTWDQILGESNLFPPELRGVIKNFLAMKGAQNRITTDAVKILLQYFKGMGYSNLQGWLANANRVVMSGHMMGDFPQLINAWLLYDERKKAYGKFVAEEQTIDTMDGPVRLKYELGFLLMVPMRKQPYKRPVCRVPEPLSKWPGVIGTVSVLLRIKSLPDLAQYWRDKSMSLGRRAVGDDPLAVRYLAHKYVDLKVQ